MMDVINPDVTKIEDGEEVVYKPLTYEKQDTLVVEGTSRKKETFFLYFCALTADLVSFATGCSLAWSSPAIPKLKSTDIGVNPLGAPITPFQESWIASLPPLGGAIGPLLTGKLADIYGRKNCLIFLALLKVTSYVILAYATDANIYYLTRFLLGIGCGMSYSILPSYIGEICEDHNRGKFGCIMGAFLALGVLYAIAIGPLLSIKLFTLSCALPLVFLVICFVTVIPETPVYLASKGNRKEAKKSLMKLRNLDQEGAELDLLEIMQIIEDSSSSSKGGYCDLFKKYALRKALVVCVGLCALQQISGINAIMAFIEPIFSSTGSEIPPNISAVVVASVQVLGTFLASTVVEKLGRRILLLTSTITCGFSLTSLAVYFHLRHIGYYYLKELFWLPVTSLIVYVLFLNVGLGPIPWAMVSEMFPSNVKATAASLATVACAVSAFSVTFLFPFMVEYLGGASCFCMFGMFCLVGGVFIYFGVPETKGKNIVEIQKMLCKSKK